MELPMFPLGSVLVPHQLLPLQVFEPRYRELVEHCLATDRRFGVVLIERGSEVGGGDVRFDVGTVAEIGQHIETPDGRYALATIGTDRFRVRQWLPDDPYPRAEVDLVIEPDVGADALVRRAAVVAGFDRVVEIARALGAMVPDGLVLDDDPVRAGWEATALAPIGPLDVLAILAEDDPALRLDRVVAALADAAELLELQLP